jgi:hypothetical protein
MKKSKVIFLVIIAFVSVAIYSFTKSSDRPDSYYIELAKKQPGVSNRLQNIPSELIVTSVVERPCSITNEAPALHEHTVYITVLPAKNSVREQVSIIVEFDCYDHIVGSTITPVNVR